MARERIHINGEKLYPPVAETVIADLVEELIRPHLNDLFIDPTELSTLVNQRLDSILGDLVTQEDLNTLNMSILSTYGPAVDAIDTEANLALATSTVNTVGKYEGRQAFDTTNDRPVWASGATATDPWKYADGTVAVTPA